jgi:hypothetical protein
MLGQKKIPNFDSSETHHDWQTWRNMPPGHLGRWAEETWRGRKW